MAGCAAPAIYVPPPQPRPQPHEIQKPQTEKSEPQTEKSDAIVEETLSEVSIQEPVEPAEKPSPQKLASLQLTEQGRILLERGKPDPAISILERAVSIDPANGENYFYLAEAWIKKKNFKQAREFNRLAGIYLKGDYHWKIRVMKQREKIK